MHDSYPGKAAKAKLCWGKNVHEEGDMPWQHMFGCMDAVFCVLIKIGLWLEIFHALVPDGRFCPFMFAFLDFPCTNPQEPMVEEMDDWAGKIKSKVYHEICRVMKNLAMAVKDLFRTHLICKMASTWVRGNSVAKDDKDHCGPWARKHISDIYDDVELDSVDAKVAAVLCQSGVCNYVVDDPTVTTDWITQNVTPNITQVFVPVLGVLFGKALLWLAYSNRAHVMPPSMVDSILCHIPSHSDNRKFSCCAQAGVRVR